MDRDWVIVFILGIGFGSVFLFHEVLLRDLGSLSVTFARLGTAALCSWAFLIVTGRSARVPAAMLGPLAMVGVFFFVMPLTSIPFGQKYVSSGVAGIVNAMTPVMTVVVSHFWPGGEKATRQKILGVIAGVAGIFIITIPVLRANDDLRLLGTLILLTGPLGFAIGFNYIRRGSVIDVIVMTTWGFTFAALMVLPLVAMIEGAPGPLRPDTWAAIAVTGILLTAVLFHVGFWILPRAGAVKVSSLTFIAPISALILGSALLGERLEIEHFTGMAVIFLGLLLVDGTLFKRPKLN